ncbi:hypothetical protein SEA_BEARBQ_46 [Gordonia phage BearBQ]|nr:hypothetical protein SEA_BEARBQ_46 [Gordonia phage BearBQ]
MAEFKVGDRVQSVPSLTCGPGTAGHIERITGRNIGVRVRTAGHPDNGSLIGFSASELEHID